MARERRWRVRGAWLGLRKHGTSWIQPARALPNGVATARSAGRASRHRRRRSTQTTPRGKPPRGRPVTNNAPGEAIGLAVAIGSAQTDRPERPGMLETVVRQPSCGQDRAAGAGAALAHAHSRLAPGGTIIPLPLGQQLPSPLLGALSPHTAPRPPTRAPPLPDAYIGNSSTRIVARAIELQPRPATEQLPGAVARAAPEAAAQQAGCWPRARRPRSPRASPPGWLPQWWWRPLGGRCRWWQRRRARTRSGCRSP